MRNKKNKAKPANILLPDFCSAQTVLISMTIGELLAIVLTLRGNEWSLNALIYLATASLFIQWIVLTDIAFLCYSKRLFGNFKTNISIFYAFVCLQIITIIISEIGYQVLKWTNIGSYPSDFHIELLASNLMISIIITALALHYFVLQMQNMRRLKAETNAKIEALQARIRPHFLFNSLNTIANLIHADPDKAEDAILDLSELFRSAMGKEEAVSLQEEIELTKQYINMEKLRLGERLTINWQQPAQLPNIKIPSLMLQPLVENSIYHGIEPSPTGGSVNIIVHSNNKEVKIDVINPVPSTSKYHNRRKGNKVALENIRQRMQLSYGAKGAMIINKTDSEHKVTLCVPLANEGKK